MYQRLQKNYYRMMCLSIIAFSICVFLIQGCAVSPVATAERERKTGGEYAEEIEQTMGLVQEHKIVGYVKELGRRLAAHSPHRDVTYRFHVVDMVEPNAFALPGGYIYVSRGLLALVNEEDELAGTIAHEIAHVVSRHHAKSAGMSVITSPFRIGTGVLGAATGILLPRVGGAIAGVGQAASAFVIAPYSRKQEREADRIGQEILAKAGYDPWGLSRFLETLGREETLHSDNPRQNSFFSTHPATDERVTKTSRHASDLSRAKGQPIAVDRPDFLSLLDGLLVGENPARGTFNDNRFLHPVLDFTLRFPPKWMMVNTPQMVAGQAPKEDAMISVQVLGRGDDPRPVVRALGEKMKADLLEDAESTRIHGLPAIRNRVAADSSEGTVGLDMTWIAHRGRVYQIMGLSPIKRFKAYQDTFEETAKSFGPLSNADRAGLKESRLRILPARRGESLKAMIGRTGGVWTPVETAVSNGLREGIRLREGQLIKLAVQQPYRGEKGR